jgi:hypothetical protein
MTVDPRKNIEQACAAEALARAQTELARISHEEHQPEWKNNTILINYTLIYLKFGIADCNSAK